MELTKQLKVEVFQVLTEYKVKIENAPFVAVLQAAVENGHSLSADILKEELLHPMSLAACNNILSRLAYMGYFERDIYGEGFDLTELGLDSAKKKEFLETRKGVIEITIAEENEFIPERIISINEIQNPKSEDENKFSRLTEHLKNLQNPNVKIPLNNIFIIEKFHEKCLHIKSDERELSINTSKQDALVKIGKYENRIVFINTKKAQNEVLRNQYNNDYIMKSNCVKMKFDNKNLSFKRNLNIDEPRLSNTIFNAIKIDNINTQPKTITDARKWFEASLKKGITSYFLSDAEFNNYAKNISDKFLLHSADLENTISKYDLIDRLNAKSDFYKIAKLETINYLNY